MKTPLIKDAAISRLLNRLNEHLEPGTFDIVDHWEADLCAIGIARTDKPGLLVYISTFGHYDDTFFISLELPPAAGSELPYAPAGEQETKTFKELLEMIQKNLNL